MKLLFNHYAGKISVSRIQIKSCCVQEVTPIKFYNIPYSSWLLKHHQWEQYTDPWRTYLTANRAGVILTSDIMMFAWAHAVQYILSHTDRFISFEALQNISLIIYTCKLIISSLSTSSTSKRLMHRVFLHLLTGFSKSADNFWSAD